MSLDIGLHSNVPEGLYFADPCPAPSLNNTLIKVLNTSTPKHAWLAHPKLNSSYEQKGAESNFNLGHAAHASLLCGLDIVSVVDANDWRTKKAQELRDMALIQGRIPMLAYQYDELRCMNAEAKHFLSESDYAGLLEHGKPEQTLVWKHKGCWMRGRVDMVWLDCPHGPHFFDYKTTACESPEEFGKKFFGYGYHTQSRFYRDGGEALELEAGYGRPLQFKFLVQESFYPYMCYWVENDSMADELATKQIARAQRLWAHCLRENHWPGYSVNDVFQMSPPPWVVRDEELMA